MEFKAIETVWESFVEAWLSINTCTGEMIRMPHDLATMDAAELKSFTLGSGLGDDEYGLLVKAENREKEYRSIRLWKTVLKAGKDIYACRLTLRKLRIFMPAALSSEFDAMILRMSAVQSERRVTLENPNIPEREFGDERAKWTKDMFAIFEALASNSNKRLFRDEDSKLAS